MTERNELHPAFIVEVDLDGDDDAARQTENARRELKRALERMLADGWIRGYVVLDEAIAVIG
jgi:hypothetical protein